MELFRDKEIDPACSAEATNDAATAATTAATGAKTAAIIEETGEKTAASDDPAPVFAKREHA